jgi:hypothetical protein
MNEFFLKKSRSHEWRTREEREEHALYVEVVTAEVSHLDRSLLNAKASRNAANTRGQRTSDRREKR